MYEKATDNDIAGAIISSLNGTADASAASLCDPSLTVYSALLTQSPAASLSALSAACRSMYPGINFRLTGTNPLNDGFTLTCTGVFESDANDKRVVNVPCECHVQLNRSRIREVWFDANIYNVWEQLGRIRPEPGVADAHSMSTNRRAAEALIKLGQRKTSEDTLTAEVLVHASIELFTDIGQGLQTRIWRFEGVDKIREVLALVRERFVPLIELSLGEGISQGFTTTFRGYILGEVGKMRQRYVLTASFTSCSERVTECWLKIAPPLTLMECLI